MTWPATLADEPDLAMGFRVHKHAEFKRSMSVWAPCCGRRTSADAVADTRTIPSTIVRSQDHDWLCDACRGRLVRDPRNNWTRSTLIQALGAPPSDVRAMRAKEILAERLKAGETIEVVSEVAAIERGLEA